MNTGILELVHAVTPAPRTVAGASATVEIVSDLAGFEALRPQWTELLTASRSDSVFLTWEWLRTWWTHLSSGKPLRILTIRRGDQLVAVAPFVSEGANVLGVTTLSFLGTGRVGSDYLDVIVRFGAEEYVLPILAEHLVTQGRIVEMKQLRVASCAGTALARAMQARGAAIRASRTHRCPVIDLGQATFKDYLGTLGAEHRYNFQRKLKKIQTRHDLQFELVTSDQRRRVALPILFELHRLRWAERGGSDGLEGSGIAQFHEEFTGLALDRGWLRLFLMWLDGRPAAALYGFRYGSVFSFYQSGFDPAYRSLGVGTVVLGLAIKHAIEEGAAEFDLLHGEEAYKFHWAKRTRALGRIRVFPGGSRGRLSCLGSAGAEAAKKAVRAISRRAARDGNIDGTVKGRHAAAVR